MSLILLHCEKNIEFVTITVKAGKKDRLKSARYFSLRRAKMDVYDTTTIYPVARMSSRCHPSSRLWMLQRDKGQLKTAQNS